MNKTPLLLLSDFQLLFRIRSSEKPSEIADVTFLIGQMPFLSFSQQYQRTEYRMTCIVDTVTYRHNGRSK